MKPGGKVGSAGRWRASRRRLRIVQGANQAVVCAHMLGRARFIGMFGNDAYASALRGVLTENKARASVRSDMQGRSRDILCDQVDIACCGTAEKPSGMALILLTSERGWLRSACAASTARARRLGRKLNNSHRRSKHGLDSLGSAILRLPRFVPSHRRGGTPCLRIPSRHCSHLPQCSCRCARGLM